MYQLNRSFNIPPAPPLGILRVFDTFAILGRREFEYQSLPGSGNLNHSLDFMWNLWVLCTWQAIMANTVLEDFHGKDCAGLKQAFCRIWTYLNWIRALNIYDRVNVLSCVYNEKQEQRRNNGDFIFANLHCSCFSCFKIIPYLKSRLNDSLKISKCKRVCMENCGWVLPQKILKIENPKMRFSAFWGLNWGQKSMFFVQENQFRFL